MIIKQIICDKCGKEIFGGESFISVGLDITFTRGPHERICGKSQFPLPDDEDRHYCKTCGRDWMLETFPKEFAAKWIEAWTGDVLVSGGSEVI